MNIIKQKSFLALEQIFSNLIFSKNKNFGKPICEFDIKIPINFENNSRSTIKLVPGEVYRIKFIPVLNKKILLKDCLIFLRKNKAILGGAENAGRIISRSLLGKTWVLSIGENTSLYHFWGSYGSEDVIHNSEESGFYYNLGFFGKMYYSNYCLSVVFKESFFDKILRNIKDKILK